MKKNLVIVICLAVALGVFYFVSQKSEQSVGIKELALPNIDLRQVTKIVYEGKEKFSIEKRGEVFVVVSNGREMPASAEALKQLFEAVVAVKEGEFITQQKASYPELKVSDSTGEKVTLYANGKALWSLIIGDYGEEGGRYIREPSDDAVYLSRGRFWDITRNNMNDFRERLIIALDADNIRSVHLEKGQQRKEANIGTDDFKMVANLRALHFIDAQEEIAKIEETLKNSGAKIVVAPKGDGPSVVVRLVHDASTNKAYAQREGTQGVFEISDYVCKQLLGT